MIFSDDLRSYRPTVLDVNRTGETAMGIEPGSGGFAIRGVIPVIAPDGRRIGSAEVLQDFNPILEAATEAEKIYISLYANNELLEFSVELQNQEIYPPKGDFVRVVEAKDASVESLITAELLSSGKTGIVYEDHPSMILAAHPITDYRGNQVGVIICAMNTGTVSTLTSTAAIIMAIMLAGTTIAPTFALLMRLRMLVTNPLNMIKAKIQDIAEDRADLGEQIPSHQNDEIGELARWFNTLTAKLEGILQERQVMFAQIRSESEKFEATAHWYESILDAIPLPVSVQDKETNWTFINRALEIFLEKKREDVTGLPCSNWGVSICNTTNCAIACAKRGLKQTYFTQDGRSHQVDVEILKNLEGEIAGFIEVVQDITQIEEMARQQAEAETANRTKSDFLANMSHEIRTPMNAIIGMTAIGKASNNFERAQYALCNIEDASTHLMGIINDILDMSKIEAGKFELSEEEFSFEKMLQSVVNVISFRVDEKNQIFNIYIDDNVPSVLFGDDLRLAQVITNLLGNAVKFTPTAGSINLNAHLLSEKDDVCEIQIEIIDSGIGLSPEQQKRLFQSFQQAESSTTRKFGGTGLGLSISKSIVEMMGGKIWVESELDKGATFSFTVLMKRGDSMKYELSIREIDWKNLRVLVVDDNNGILGYMKSFVERHGAICDTAGCGIDALKIAKRNGAYDIYFVDWKMADIDALQLTKGLKAIEPKKNKTVITMISSITWGDIEESAKKAGVDQFLPKPLFPSAITETINDFLGVAQQQIVKTVENSLDVFRGKRILVTEDVEINREIVLTLLEPTHVEIDCVETGMEALNLFMEMPDKYDMIFMDIQMPGIDGYETTQRIRAFEQSLGRSDRVPIIAMTANVYREDIEKCLAAGMNDHIGKPVDFNEVLEKLRHYLL